MPVGPSGERLPYPGDPGYPGLAPAGGGAETFGPQGVPALGAAPPPPAGADLFGTGLEDPNAPVDMGAVPGMGGPGSISEAILGAVAGQMQQLGATQQAEMAQILDMQLMEAEDAIGQLRTIIGAEAQTLQGPGGIPGDGQMAGIGPATMGQGEETGEGPGGMAPAEEAPEGMVSASQGMGGPPMGGPVSTTPMLAQGGMPPGAEGLPPELLAQLMRGA